MLTFGVVVEGPYDAAAIPEFIRACLESNVQVISRPCGGTRNLMRRFPGFLKEFRHLKQGAPVDKAFVIRDADNKDPNALITRMREKYADREYPFPVEPVIIVQELETWLLADNSALSQVTERHVTEFPGTLEDVVAPKERLQQILLDYRTPYTQLAAKKLARAANPDILEYRCPSFRNFRQALLP